MSYSERLPREIKRASFRCQALDDDGQRCLKRAQYEVVFFGDPELDQLQWVMVHVCGNHLPDSDLDKLKERG